MTRIAALSILSYIIASSPAAIGAEVAPEVTAIEVRLFQNHTGTLSEPIAEGATLWNTVIGEGDAREPSTSTFVKVKVAGAPSSYRKNAAVQLTVKTPGKNSPSAKLKKSLGVFDREGNQFVAFWLPNTGCETLLLSARATGSPKVLQHTDPFKCGE